MHNNYRVILRTIGLVLIFEGIAMLVPLAYAVWLDDASATAFFTPAVFCLGLGLFIHTQLKYYTLKIKQRESYFIAFVCWITVSFMGIFPYMLADQGYSLADCIFESVSGWTTTGAWTVNVPSMPKPLLLWKATTNWLGGMGILLLTISFFPVLGAEGQKMINAEMPGIQVEKMSTRISDTAKISYMIYVIMTVVEFLLLLPTGLTPFEALLNTMSTISTAGLINVGTGNVIAVSPYVTGVFTAFSIFGSINFMMYFYLYKRKWSSILNNVEVRAFLKILAVGSAIIALTLFFTGTCDSLTDAFGTAIAQSVAYGATSGFEVADLNAWPGLCKIVLIILLLIGGCSNSTSGSIKVIRFIIFLKLIKRGIYKRIHPKAVKPVMIQGRPVSAASVSSISVFLMLYFLVFVFGSLVFSLENLDMETTFCTTLACITNNGTAFGGIVGGNFSILSEPGKIFSSILMLAGRLEMYAIILLFSRSFWNPNRAT
ncbi:MAG: TrkH family potassium uptake protein [Firmicutes bacterium]|nr:TrkH family potassium uptake protein [Bacillota bacterium]